MGNTVKNILLAAIAAGVFVIAYIVYNNSNTPKVEKPTPVLANSGSKVEPNFDPLKQTKSNTEEVASNAQITFDKFEHDFGNILQDTENKVTFTFTNTGTEPLILQDAKGSCGCTAPNYTKEPVAPGEKGSIEVVYKPGKQKNQQTKTVTVTANTNPKATTLRIKANVLEFGS